MTFGPLQAWALSDFSGMQSCSPANGPFSSHFQNAATTLSARAQPVQVAVANLSGPAPRPQTGTTLAADLMLGSDRIPAGGTIAVEAALALDGRPAITFYVAQVKTQAQASPIRLIFADAPLTPGTTYRFAPNATMPQNMPVSASMCFSADTLIATDQGPQPAATLSAGDHIFTRESGYQPLTWVGRTHLSTQVLRRAPELAPVRFDPGALQGLETPLLLCPRHRVLHCSATAQFYFGAPEVLIPAKGLVNGATIRPVVPEEGITYVQLLCADHQIIQATGVWAETLLPAESTLATMDEEHQRQIRDVLPSLATSTPARRLLNIREARALAA